MKKIILIIVGAVALGWGVYFATYWFMYEDRMNDSEKEAIEAKRLIEARDRLVDSLIQSQPMQK